MATTNYLFTTLTGTETAGYTSINTLISSIDTQLNKRIPNKDTSGTGAYDNMVPMYSNAAASGFTQGLIDTANIAASAITEAKIASGAVTNTKIGTNAVTLGTQTTGDYVATVTAAGTNEVAVTGTGEAAAATVRLADNTALRGAATVGTPPTYSGGSTGTVGRIPDAKYVTDALAYATSGNVTLSGDVTGNASANTIANGAITSAKILDGTIVGDDIASNTITYNKLNTNAKRYDVTTGGAGLVFTSSGSLSTTSASTNPTQQPLVAVDSSAGAVVLTLPTTGFSTIPGATITIAQLAGSNTVTIQPGTGVFINGSNSNTYVLGGLYSVVTLILISTGNSWIITGDYI